MILLGWLVVLWVIVLFFAAALGRFEPKAAEPAPQQTSAEHGTRRTTPVQGRDSQSPFDRIRSNPFERARVAPAPHKMDSASGCASRQFEGANATALTQRATAGETAHDGTAGRNVGQFQMAARVG